MSYPPANAPTPPARRRPSLAAALGCAAAAVVAVVGGRAGWQAWAAREDAAARAAYAEYLDLAGQYRDADWRHRRSVVEREMWDELAATDARRGEVDRARDHAREADKRRQNEAAMWAHLADLEDRLRTLEQTWGIKWVRLRLPLGRGDEPPAGK